MIDPERTLQATIKLDDRLRRLENSDLASASFVEVAAGVLADGWTLLELRDDGGHLVTESPLGWGTHRLNTASERLWPHLTVGQRRHHLREQLIRPAMLFSSLGTWTEFHLRFGTPRTQAAVWPLLVDRLGTAEVETLRFLHALAGPERQRR